MWGSDRRVKGLKIPLGVQWRAGTGSTRGYVGGECRFAVEAQLGHVAAIIAMYYCA